MSIFMIMMIIKYNHLQKKIKKKVLTYGTFDLFHYGHQNLFSNMVKLLGKNIKIYVGIASDKFNAIKGKKAVDSFEVRSENVKKHPNVAETFKANHWKEKVRDIKRIKPDFFVMGSDWAGKYDGLNKFCKVVYLPRTPGISSTMLRKQRALLQND
ncbi:adenylyltransferase/cytidyltransferase family protein [Candidatus Dependentiae bacterium]